MREESRSGESEPWPQELWVEGRALHSPFSFEPRALRPPPSSSGLLHGCLSIHFPAAFQTQTDIAQLIALSPAADSFSAASA